MIDVRRERKLWAAVLQLAICDGATKWIETEGDPDAVCTFEWVCEAIQVDPSLMRRRLLALMRGESFRDYRDGNRGGPKSEWFESMFDADDSPFETGFPEPKMRYGS